MASHGRTNAAGHWLCPFTKSSDSGCVSQWPRTISAARLSRQCHVVGSPRKMGEFCTHLWDPSRHTIPNGGVDDVSFWITYLGFRIAEFNLRERRPGVNTSFNILDLKTPSTTSTRRTTRSSRETELAKDIPIYVFIAWLGNTPKIAKRIQAARAVRVLSEAGVEVQEITSKSC